MSVELVEQWSSKLGPEEVADSCLRETYAGFTREIVNSVTNVVVRRK
jgi:hypothetical protein